MVISIAVATSSDKDIVGNIRSASSRISADGRPTIFRSKSAERGFGTGNESVIGRNLSA